MAFPTWWIPPIDRNTVALLHIFLPFVAGFSASWLIYGWISKAGLQSAGFSPTVAAILTTPLLAVAWYILARVDFIHDSIAGSLHGMLAFVFLFAPIILVQPLLLAIYLRGVFRWKKIFWIALCAATVALTIFKFLGIAIFLSGSYGLAS
jgi:hypothetical protein